MTKRTNKFISLLLTLCMTLSVFAGLSTTAFAADGVTVKIVSFLRGEQNDLRASELLEARVSGYDGNVRDLTYEWTNEIGTYLYVYNNHNMYGINGTSGEVEIYNDDVDSSSNMAGRSYKDSFSGQGFAWAAIYGANYSNSDLLGTITVTVKDANGNVIATDSHTGTRSGRFGRYTYSGFVADNLGSDLQATAFGIFEGDAKHIKELFSESSIVHISCVESTVTDAAVTSGREYISLTDNSDGTYTVNALKPGVSEIKMTVEKGNCKFHQYSDGESTTKVYVYKRPVPTPTTTTITLTNLDEHCTYYIDGVQGKYQADGTVIFEGLTPNTTYTIEAQGQAEGTDVVYAYTQATTLPVYNATIKFILDGGYDATAATAYGTLVDINEVEATDNQLFLKEESGSQFIPLTHSAKGTYTAAVENGTYNIFEEENADTQICDQELDIVNQDRIRYLFYYSVKYDAAGGIGAPATVYEHESHAVTVSSQVPTYEGYNFIGWKDQDGNIYQPGAVLTTDIEKAYTLTAQWEEATSALVNLKVVVDHEFENGMDPKIGGTLTVDLAYRHDASETYVEVVGKEASFDDWYQTGTREGNITTKEYPALYTELSGKYEYSANVFLEHYQVTDAQVNKTTDAEGNATYDVTVYLKYNPDLFMLQYKTVADQSVPEELIPQATGIKILNWDASVEDEWAPISRHKEYSVDVEFVGRNGNGSYGVPIFNNGALSYYRVHAAGLTLNDGTEILLETKDGINYYSLATDNLGYGAYSAVVTVKGGADVEGTDLDGAYGAYITADLNGNYAQQGEILVTVYVNRYDVIFNSNGGSAVPTIEDQFTIPNVSEYVPTKAGYTFAGWYTDTALTAPVVPGTVMSSDVTLYAKWEENKKVKGTVSIAGSYELEDGEHVILDKDRANKVVVLLQRIDGNGYFVSVANQTVEVNYNGNVGTGTFEFADVPNDGKDYRIKAMAANYGDLYQNEVSSSTVVTDFGAYDTTHYIAEYNGDATAVVNAYLPFEPQVFDLSYSIDATAISEGFRPDSFEMVITCDDKSGETTPQKWAVISQMIKDGEVVGEDVALSAGVGNGSYPVWQSHADGVSLYDYSLALKTCTVNGDEKLIDVKEVPFMIYYSNPVRYSAVAGQTHELKATVVPKMFTITFDTQSGEELITGMEAYATTTGIFQDTYYWSFGKAISARPVRQGYRFLGWFDEAGNKVTEVTPDKAEDITVYAKWEAIETYINNYAYIFGYNDSVMGAEGPLLRCEVSAMVHRLVKQNGKLGDFVYNEADTPDFNDIVGEWFRSGIEYVNHKGAFPKQDNVYPYVQVTRGEAFKIICIGLGFVEDTTLSNAEYADFLYSAGYIQGDENGNLNVDSFITRAEFCTMYNRIIGREMALLETKAGEAITAETYGFTDLDSEKWYYEAMVRATSAYDDEGYVDLALRGIRNDLDDYNG